MFRSGSVHQAASEESSPSNQMLAGARERIVADNDSCTNT